MISIHPGTCLLGSVDSRDAKPDRTGAVDDSSQQKTGPESASLLNRIAHRSNEFKLIPAVADGGDTGREIDRAPLHLLEMSMHVPEPGKQELSFRINDVCVFRNFHLAARTDSHDDTVVDDDC